MVGLGSRLDPTYKTPMTQHEMTDPPPPTRLHTPSGDFPLRECRINVGGREWAVVYTAALVSPEDESRFLGEFAGTLPYGVVLWPAAIALAHEVATRADEFRGRRVLELGAGTGLPGVVAASLGARVVQTDRNEGALDVCRHNGERNGAIGIVYCVADWTDWHDAERYDWIIGSDVLYGEELQPSLRRIFEANLAPGARVLIADPFRAPSLRFLEVLEGAGWKITMSKWTIGEEKSPRAVGVFEMSPAGPNAM